MGTPRTKLGLQPLTIGLQTFSEPPQRSSHESSVLYQVGRGWKRRLEVLHQPDTPDTPALASRTAQTLEASWHP